MSLSWLSHVQTNNFPPLEHALPDGLLAAGGDLSSQRLITAYSQGIFPWFNKDDPILWWSPNPRMVLLPEKVKISKSLAKTIKHSALTITIDTAFAEVMACCAQRRRNQEQNDDNHTWIHPSMIQAYTELHQQGIAHSVECWHDGQLVGGLYGLALGQIFFGESMFSRERDASKIALVALCKQLLRYGFPIIDCQVYSDHLARLGAEEIDRQQFRQLLESYCPVDVSEQCWQLNITASSLL